MVQTLWDSITEFLSPEAGQARTRALNESIGYYIPPEMRGLLGFVADATPSAAYGRAAQASQEMVAPDRSIMDRIGSAGRMLSSTAEIAAPMAVAGRAGMPAAQAVQEGLLGLSMGADDAARQFVMDDSGAIKLWHGSPYDFDRFDLARIGSGEGAQDLGRGFSLSDEESIAHLYTNPASRWMDLDAMERYRQAGPGRYYEVSVDAEPEQFLDWGKPWRQQVKEGTPLHDLFAQEEARYLANYADDPAMQAAIPQAKVSNFWRDNAGLEEAAAKSGFVGNLRKNYGGDTEYTVFDPALMNIERKFDKDGNLLTSSLPAPRNGAEAMARQVLEMRAAGRAGDVTEEMRAAADPMYMFENTPLPMDEASRMARADQYFPDTAYHSTGRDFQEFIPSEFRGASFFATTPEGASRGASASANEGVGSGTGMIIPARVDTRGVSGIGSYGTRDMNEFRASLPDRIYSESEMDALMASDAAPSRGDWTYFFDDLTDYDALRAFRDANPVAPIPEGIIKFRPKQPLSYSSDLRLDITGRQFPHYSEGMSERPSSNYAISQGNTGFAMMDESGLALAMTDPSKIRSRFALFDPEFRHLRNLSAGIGGLGLLSLPQDEEMQ